MNTAIIKLNLPFQHTVRAYTVLDDGAIVTLVENRDGSVQPWVTYRVDSRGNCYWGHYFRDKASAVRDFEERCGAFMEVAS